jgi:catalase
MATKKTPKSKAKVKAKAASNDRSNGLASTNGGPPPDLDLKRIDLQTNSEDSSGEFLTTNQGVRVNDNQNSLKAGDRGPTLMEDFIFREKITHFDHERIPERVVHARGSGAHGYFQVYEPMTEFTKADFLQDPAVRTPVFVRFSTVVGSRGSTDLARDVRGFATKFYTREGIFDLVGNNIPVFFIQDAIKFPDLVHAVKPEQHHEIPQAASAHKTFWDFISLMPESMHMIMWLMSDRAIPRSYRMMEGFGVHTFRLVNAKGKARFVKFHWKPLLGVHSVLWDEAQKISGKDPDFHRRDLWEAIENRDFPEWEFCVQIVEERDEHKFEFDLLDPTKIIPEEVVPVKRIGKLTLNRNPDNFFAETEQVAFHIANIVPGIDFTNDPLLQGRLFSYLDTQLIRLGGPNFHEIPINRPIAPLHNNQRDGYMRQTINRGITNYEPNSLRGGCPFQAGMDMSGFTSYAERIDAQKIRQRSPSFHDHFSQATLFYNSQTEVEKNHIIRAFCFELGKVETPAVRERMLTLLAQVDRGLAQSVAAGLGAAIPKKLTKPLNMSIPADMDPKKVQPKRVEQRVDASAALRQIGNPNFPNDTIHTRRIAVLLADGFDDLAVEQVNQLLLTAGATPKLVSTHVGSITGANGRELNAEFSFLTASSVLFDAVFVAGGGESAEKLTTVPEAREFLMEAYKHCKTVGFGAGAEFLLTLLGIESDADGTPEGVIVDQDGTVASLAEAFITAVMQHRHWTREPLMVSTGSPLADASATAKSTTTNETRRSRV